MGSWKMKCIDKGNSINPYTEGKVYEVKHNVFVNDNGKEVYVPSITSWRCYSKADWRLVEDSGKKKTKKKTKNKYKKKLKKAIKKIEKLKKENSILSAVGNKGVQV